MLRETDSVPSSLDLLEISLNPKTTFARSFTLTGTWFGAEISASFIPSGESDTDKESESLFDDSFSEDEEEKEEYEEPQKPTSGKSSLESKIAVLQEKLREAIEKEDYERAAILRDEISKLQGTNN